MKDFISKTTYHKIINTIIIVGLLFPYGFAFPEIASANFNEQINYQGKLTNSSNTAVADGLYHMKFRLYTQAVGGSHIWEDDRSTVVGNRINVTNGLFSVLLGSSTPLTSVNFNQDLWLEVEIGGTDGLSWETLSPRKQLGSVPSAFEAKRLNGLTSEQFLRSDASNSTSTASTYFTIIQNGAGKIAEFFGPSSSSVLSVTSTGRVGIGSTTPNATLSVNGNSYISGTAFFGGGITSTSTLNISGLSTLQNIMAGQATTTNLAITNITSSLLKTNASGSVVPAILGTDFEAPLTFSGGLTRTANNIAPTSGYNIPLTASTTDWNIAYINRITSALYPLQISSNSISLAFGTTTANTWSQLQIFNGGATTTQLTATGNTYLATLGGRVGIGTSTPTSKLNVLDSSGVNGVEKIVAAFNVTGSGAQSPALVLQSNNATGLRLTHLNDFQTGFIDMNYSGASALAFGVRGSEKVRIDNNGNVGIGTTSPSAKLSVKGGGTTTGRAFAVSDSANTERFTILDNGRVGIGTTSPQASLQIYNNIISTLFSGDSIFMRNHYTGSGWARALLGFENEAGSDYWQIGGYGNGQTSVYGYIGQTYNDAAIKWNSANNVGIGMPTTVNPLTRLDVRGLTSAPTEVVGGILNIGSTDAQSAGVGGSISLGGFQDDAAGQYRIFASVQGLKENSTSGNRAGYLSFSTNNNPSMSEKMRITSTGNVGIGTTSPYAKLSVVGETVSEYFTATTTTGTSTLPNLFATNLRLSGRLYDSANSAGINGMVLQTTGSGTQWVATSTLGFASATQIGAGTQGQVPFYNSAGSNLTATSAIFISQSGNVGVGTVSPSAKLHLAGDIKIGDSNPWQFTKSAAKTFDLIAANESSAGHTFRIGLGGWSGDSVEIFNNGAFANSVARFGNNTNSWLAANGGNVGIGTTSPSRKLDVFGDAVLSTTNITGNTASLYLGANSRARIDGIVSDSATFADELAFRAGNNITGSQERMRITYGGNVGIGTTTPIAKLNVTGDANPSGEHNGTQFIINGSTNPLLRLNVGVNTTSNYAFINATNAGVGTLPLSLNPQGGNVGIGTITPTTNLDVRNQAQIRKSVSYGATDDSTYLYLGPRNDTNDNLKAKGYAFNVAVSGASNQGRFTINEYSGFDSTNTFTVPTTNLTPVFTISNGNIGIGTTSPSAKLSIKGGGTTTGRAFAVSDSADTERFTILDNGNVGIGTTSPSSVLSVVGSNSASWVTTTQINGGANADNAGSVLALQSNGGVYGGKLYAGRWSSTDRGVRLVGINQSSIENAYLHINAENSTSYISLATAATERLRITNTGNVGIGTTSPSARLSVKGGGTTTGRAFAVSDSADTERFTILDNGNVGIGNTSPSAKLTIGQGTDVSTSGLLLLSSGGSSGRMWVTSGGAVSIQRGDNDGQISLVNSGNVGIGTTSPYSKLSVWGGTTDRAFEVVNSASTTLLSVSSEGFGTTTVSGLNIAGSATTTSNVGINLSGGCFAINGSCLSNSTYGNTDVNAYIHASTTIPKTYTANTFTALQTLNGGLTVSGNTTLSSIAVNSLLSTNASGQITATSTPTFGNFNATSTTATSTIAGGLAIGGNKFVVDYSTGNVGIGTNNPASKLTVSATQTSPGTTYLSSNNLTLTDAGGSPNSYYSQSNYLENLSTTAAYAVGGISNYLFSSSTATTTNSYGTDNFINASTGYLGSAMGGKGISNAVGTRNYLYTDSGGGVSGYIHNATGVLNYFFEYSDSKMANIYGIYNQYEGVDSGTNVYGFYNDHNSTASNHFAIYASGSAKSYFGGNVGIGTTSPYAKLSVVGETVSEFFTATTTTGTSTLPNLFATNLRLSGRLYDSANSAGTNGMVLQSNGSGATWVSTTTLGLGGTGSDPSIGGTLTGATAGSVLFAGSGTFAQDNANFFWNNSTKRLGVGTSTPQSTLHVEGESRFNITSGFQLSLTSASLASGINLAGNSTIHLGPTTNNSLVLYTNSTERMRVLNTGNVGIGTTTPFAKLSIHANNGETNTTLFNIASSTGSATTSLFTVLNNGNVGIGISNPTAALQVNGAIATNDKFILGTGASYAGRLVDGGSFISLDTYNGSDFTSRDLYLRGNTVSIHTGSTPSERITVFSNGHVVINNSNSVDNALSVKRTATFDTGATSLTAVQIYGRSGQTANLMQVGATGANGGLFAINALGNVGVGTTTPFAKLSIHANNGETNTTLFNIASSTGSATTSLFTVLNNGNVGIGNISATQALTVSGTAYVTGNYIVGAGGGLRDSTTQNQRFNVDATTASIWTNNQNRIIVNQDGNVGIGTTTPNVGFHVNNAGDGAIEALSTVPTRGALFGNSTTNAVLALGVNGGNASWIQARTKTAGGIALDMSLNPLGGNVGVGTSTPATKLQISSGAQTNPMVAGTASGHLSLTDGNGAYGLYMGVLGTGNSWVQAGRVASAQYYDLLLQANGGKVGIGTTTPFAKLSINPVVGDSASFVIGSSTATSFIVDGSGKVGVGTVSPQNNIHVSGPNSSFRLQNSTFTDFFVSTASDGASLTASGGDMHFYTNSAGYQYGNERMTIKNTTGRVGIGTTTPFAKLSVNSIAGEAAFVVGSSTRTDFIVNSNGNVGIGRANPNAKLEVDAGLAGGNTSLLLQNNEVLSFKDSVGNVRRVLTVSGLNVSYLGPIDAGWGASTVVSAGTDLSLRVNGASGAFTTAMSIDTSGKVGIGTTSPYAKLSVVGETVSEYFTATTTTGTSTLPNLFATNLRLSGRLHDSTNSAGTNGMVLQSTGSGVIWVATSTLGLGGGGGTPGGSNKQIQFNNNGSFGGSELYWDSVNNRLGFGTSTPTTKMYITNEGDVRAHIRLAYTNEERYRSDFSMATSTGAGWNAYDDTANEYLPITIDGSKTILGRFGNIGMGVTSPTAKLDIQGSASADIFRIATSTGGTVIEINEWGSFIQTLSSTTAFSIQTSAGSPVFEVDTSSTNNSGIDITASAGQTSNLLNMFSSGGTFLSGFTASGGLFMNISSTTALNIMNGSGSTALVVNSTSQSVGIGTSTLTYTLNVDGDSDSNYIARINNKNTGTGADGLLISLGVANASRTTGNYFIGFSDGTQTVAGKIQGGASAVAYTTSGADLAEYFRVADTNDLPQSGEIVMLDQVGENAVLRADYGTLGMNEPVGIVSTNPGFVGNGPVCKVGDIDCDINYAKYNVLVALVGQVPVKVSDENGEILAGDYLTLSSTTPGVAVKMIESGYTVGRALTLATTTEKVVDGATTTIDTVIVLVEKGWRDVGGVEITDLNGGESLEVPTVFAGLFNFLKKIGLEIGNNFVKLVNLVVEKITAQRVETGVLCLDDVCITKTELQQILNSAGQSPAIYSGTSGGDSGGGSTDDNTTSDDTSGEETVSDGTTVSEIPAEEPAEEPVTEEPVVEEPVVEEPVVETPAEPAPPQE